MANNYIVAGCKPWNRRIFDEVIKAYLQHTYEIV